MAGSELYAGDAHARRVDITTGAGRPVYAAHFRAEFFNPLRKVIKALAPNGDGQANRHLELHGTCVLLGAHFADSSNYFHFWVDIIGDLWFSRQLGVGTDEVDHYVLPFTGARWQREILELCGVPLEKVVPLSSFYSLRATELVVPVRAKGGRNNPPWLLRAMRESAGYSFDTSPRPHARHIYVSRRGALRRPLEGEAEIIAFLRSRGYEEVSCDGLTVREQQRLFGDADSIIAPHGAALTNLIWCRPGTRVVEFLPVKHANPCFFDISRMGELDYGYIPASLVDSDAISFLTGGVRIQMDDLHRLFE
jgi:capsular polysaccharide biosynthesis protein